MYLFIYSYVFIQSAAELRSRHRADLLIFCLLISWKFDQISFRLWHNMAKKVNPKFDLGAQADVWLVTPPDRTREEPTAR